MTREEAIQVLKEISSVLESWSDFPEYQKTTDRPRCYSCIDWNSETKGCKRNPSLEEWNEDDYCSYYCERGES